MYYVYIIIIRIVLIVFVYKPFMQMVVSYDKVVIKFFEKTGNLMISKGTPLNIK